MVARKSSRVKKTTVAYQAPEPVHRTPRNAQPKTVPSRRSFNRDIELYMECVEDELSPAQLKAIKDAQKEHEKANDLIKEVRAGNTLVPSSQPNTFTIVPPKPSPAPPKPALVSKAQTPTVTSVQLDTSSQRGLPPPRPAQFLSKQLQQMKKTSGTRVSPDVILISDSSVAPTTPKMTMVNVPVAHISGNQLQMQPMTNVIASPGSGAVTQQVYKFVTLPSSMPTSLVNNQYTLRPMLTVPSQQQQQLAFLTTGSQGITNVSSIATTSPHQDKIPVPKSAGEELKKVGGAKLLQGQGDYQGSTVIHNTYLKSSKGSHSKNNNHSLTVNHQQRKAMQFKKCRRKCYISCKGYSWKVRSHHVRTLKLSKTCRKTAFGRPLLTLGRFSSKFKCWHKKRKIKIRINKSKKRSFKQNCNLTIEANTNNLNINCDKQRHSCQDSRGGVQCLKHKNSVKIDPKKGEASLEMCSNQCIGSDNLNSQSCAFENDVKTDVLWKVLNEKTGSFNELKEERKTVAEKEVECLSNDLWKFLKCVDKKEDLNVLSHGESEGINFSHMKMPYCQCDRFEFQAAFSKFFEQQTVFVKDKKDLKTQCNIVVDDVEETIHTDLIRTPITEHNSAENSKLVSSSYQDSSMEAKSSLKTRNSSDLKVGKVRTPLRELNISSKTENDKDLLETAVPNIKEKRRNEKYELSSKLFDGIGQLERLEIENRRCFTQVKDIDFKREATKKKKREKSLHKLCKTLLDDYMPSNFSVVNMVYESTRFMPCDTENQNMRTSDECSSGSEGQINGMTNISCVKTTEVAEVPCNNVDSNSNEIRDHNTSEVQDQDCLNKVTDKMKEKKQSNESIVENIELCNNNVVTRCNDMIKIDAQERKCSSSANDIQDIPNEDPTEHSKLCDRTKESCDIRNISELSGQLCVKTDTSGLLSQANKKVYSDIKRIENAGKCYELENTKRKWYENMTMEDEVYIVLLCSQYGFTKISKDLQIPKTELLKLRRSVKKSKWFHSKVHEMSQKDEIIEPTKSRFPEKKCLNKAKDAVSCEESVLKEYHPCMYKTAQTLLKTMNKSECKFKDEFHKLECDETKLDTDLNEARFESTSGTRVNKDEMKDERQIAAVDKLSAAIIAEKAVRLQVRKDANECDMFDSEPEDLIICLDGFEDKVLIDNNKQDNESDTEGTDKTVGHCDKYSKNASVEGNGKEERNNEQLLGFINTDHCYVNVLTGTAETDNQKKIETNVIELEDEIETSEQNAAHIPLNDCLTYPDGAMQLFDGRVLSVYYAISKDKLNEIAKYLAVFGSEAAVEHYKMPEEHLQFFVYHAMTCSKDRMKSVPHLEDGIPYSYESSNHLKELPFKLFPEVISLDYGSSFDRLSANSDLSRGNKSDKLKSPLRGTFVVKMDKTKCKPSISLSDGDRKKLAVQNSATSKCSERTSTLNSDAKSEKIIPKLKRASSKSNGSTVYTNDFLNYFKGNNLHFALDRTPSKQLILENQAAFDMIQTEHSVKTYFCNGLERHRYSPDFQRQLMLLACTVGVKAVADYFNISYKTIKQWKKNLRKALENHTTVGIDEVTKVKKNAKPNMPARKRVILSLSLKMKLCSLCDVEGISAVSVKTNVSTNSLRRWRNELEFASQPNCDLTDEDFVELIKYGEYKRSAINTDITSYKTDADGECPDNEIINNGEQQLLCMQNNPEVINDIGNTENCCDSVNKGDADQNIVMTYPNNMEVILDDDDSVSVEGSDICIAESPLTDSESNNVPEKEESVANFSGDNSSGGINSNSENLKKDFLKQNTLVLDSVRQEEVLSDSDHEGVVEIVSWNVKNADDIDDKEVTEPSNMSDNNMESLTDLAINTVKQTDEDIIIIQDEQQELQCLETNMNNEPAGALENKIKMCRKDFTKEKKDPARSNAELESDFNHSGTINGEESCSKVIVEQDENDCVDLNENNMAGNETDELRKDFAQFGEPECQSFCPVVIKDEPYDEEFDRIEHGANSEKQISEFDRNKNFDKSCQHDRVNKSGIDLKCNEITTNSEGDKSTGFNGSDINQLGTGDENTNRTQGYTFQSTSGSANSGSQRTGQTNIPGNVPNTSLNINNLSSENVQIVGTHDLIPGQEYILVDPRLFNSVSNSFQNLNPQSLLRPSSRSSTVTTVSSVRPRVPVRGMVPSVPNISDQPTPVHIVENRSLQIGTSQNTHIGSVSPLQSNMHRPTLILHSPQNQTNVSPTKPGCQTIKSLLSGYQFQSKGARNTKSSNYLTDQSLEHGESVKHSSVIHHSNITSKGVVNQSNAVTTQGVCESAQLVSTSCTTIVEQTPASDTKKDNDKVLSYTLKGVGSISNKDISNNQVVKPNTTYFNRPSTSAEATSSLYSKEQEKIKKQEQFSKYLPNTDMLLEKERKLLETLLLQKTNKKQSTTKLESSTKTESKYVEEAGSAPNCNRIDSLIKKMTNRVQKGSGDTQMNLNLPLPDTNKPAASEEEHGLKPASASEILFGEHTSPKKKEVEKDPLLKSNSVKSSLFGNRLESLSSGPKKELRKSPIVMREIDSSEDESSNSSVSESSSSEGTDSVDNVGEHEHSEGRIEHVDLSAKLKSLLSADIFNVIEPEKGDNSEDDDLIEILAKPSCSGKNLNIDSKQRHASHTKIIADNKTQGNITEKSASVKRTSINYSLNIKKKLGKLASMFSTVSLHKKYGVNPQTLSKWKAKYQDEEIAGLELTEEELKELEEVSKIRKANYGSNAQEYDIYVDNPEEDEQEHEPKKTTLGVENFNKEKVEKKYPHPVKTDENNTLTRSDFGKSSWLPKKSVPNVGKSEKTDQNRVKMGTPLYITIDDDASDEIKQQLRQNLKIKKTAEHTWSNGAFVESSNSSFASVFGTSKPESVGNEVNTVVKPQTVSFNKSDTESASEKECDEIGERDTDQRHKTISRLLNEKTSTPSNDIWEKTVYLCPDEGIFKYRYEKKSRKVSADIPNENQNLSVLDRLFQSSDNCPTPTESQVSVKETASLPSKQVDASPELLKMTKNKALPESSDSDKEVYTEVFKWTVVEEARKSGFEKTAKWFGISMTDIMKWHDSFLHEKKSKELSTEELAHNKTESSSAVVELVHDDSIHSIKSPVKRKTGLNANLSFERIQVKEGAITKPRFNTRTDSQPSTTPLIPVAAPSPNNRPQRTRMGPNTIKYATPRVDPDQLQKFQADVQGDLGIMPKLMKKPNSRDGVEIASTWKQVQSVLKPEKPVERRYTQEFKQKIIAECERKGQKTVAQENRIPYNEISRWRLEAKKCAVLPTHQNSAFTKTESSKRNDSLQSTIISSGSKKTVPEQSTSQSGKNESKSGTEHESLKIKIKLSTLSQPTPHVSKKKVPDQSAIQESSNKVVPNTTSPEKATSAESGKKPSPVKAVVTSRASKTDSDKSMKKPSNTVGKNRTVERSEPGQIDEDADLRMEVINFCFDQGVLKTQKKYNVTRQSIIDLMKEYDELSKYEVDNYNKAHGFHSFRTKLVSREKTSVEVTSTATQPVIVKNLNDYIVTQEYMKTVVDYALKHGITAASRKYKRKTSTVRSWMNQFQREVKKKISVEQVAKEQELIANNVSIEEARKISNLEARKKKQLLEAEFRRHIVEFARQFGITAASRRFKKKAATVKSWMGHFMKSERDAKRQEVLEIRQKQISGLDPTSPKLGQNSAQDSHVHKSPSSSRQRTPPQSPLSLWDQDFVIKPSSSKSPLKLTFSPRRKSSPVIVIGSSTEEDNVDDETNDIETDDEQEHVPGEYFEVAAWNLDSSGEKSESKGNDSNKTEESILLKEPVIDLVSDEDITDKRLENDSSLKIDTDVENFLNACTNDSTNLEKSLTDSAAEDSMTVSIDDTSILNLENANSVNDKERLLRSGTLEGNETTGGNISEVQDLAETAKIEDEAKEPPETEKIKMPYEETVMFKLMTDELDNFMKNVALVAKYNVPKEPEESKYEDQTPVVKEKELSDVKPMKRFKKFADTEIMQNIEETYLFTGTRVTRNAVGKELKNLDDTSDSKEDDNKIESEEGCLSEQDQSPNDKPQIQERKDEDVQILGNENSGVDDRNSESENDKKEVTVELPAPDNQKKGERSLFDILSSESKNQNEVVDEVAMVSSIASDEKSDKMKPSFNLFGNLMKSFKVEGSIDVKNTGKADNKNENTSASSGEVKDQEGIVKSEEFVKDRTERNLFDFICPEPDIPKTPTKLPPPPQPQTSPRMQTRSLFRSEKASALSPQKSSPLKITPIKKPMFKFPKFSLPVNFGNIAKLGMAKMKEEEEKSKVENVNKTDDDSKHGESEKVGNLEKDEKLGKKGDGNEISTKESAADGHEQSEVKSNVKTSGAQEDIVMETFEELRQRLSKERAASKLEKERAKIVSETESVNVDLDEIDGSSETTSSVTAKTSIEIDSEMYENFTPQKIVLILDISKKHGIEFASTSFGLPVSVIVNWIIEKDRKHRKVALSVSLEEKLKALKSMKDGELTRDEVKEKYNVDDTAIQKWDSEICWMIEDKNVCDVLEKWKTVETVSNINFEECSKNLERRDSVVEKEVVEDQVKLSVEKSEVVTEIKEVESPGAVDTDQHKCIKDEKSQTNDETELETNVTEKSESNDVCLSQEDNVDNQETNNTDPSIRNLDEKNTSETTENPAVDSNSDVQIKSVTDGDEMEKHSEEAVMEESTNVDITDVPDSSDDQKDIPEIISFVKTTRPRDFTVEQKAMIVLLMEKYGNQLVHKKFGINTGTVYCWRHTSKNVRQYLYDQGYSFNKSKDGSSVKDDKVPEKTLPNESNSISSADFLPSRETRSTSDKKITEELNAAKEKKEAAKEPTTSKAEQTPVPKLQGKELGHEKDLIDHPKGYRIISPTKLPPVLKDVKDLLTKDYSLEQRVAIVKLVRLYGVRTVHKQFRISTGSIWNWQHCKNITDVLKKEEMADSGSQGAQRAIDFNVDDNDEEEPVTIDTILDRVLITAETLSHLAYDLEQRADIVCLIQHFGIDYFCEKVPQIPKGTLWNWRHNKQVLALVEKRNQMMKECSDKVNKYQSSKGRENVVGESVDKAVLTQNWLKDVQDNIHSKSKRRMDDSEISMNIISRKKPKLGPMSYKRSFSNDRHRRSLSPSTVCSETSVHSDDFEEICSDDELNTPSVISKKSGTSSQTVQSNKTSKSQQKISKGNAPGKSESGLVSANGLETDTTSVPVHEIIKFETGQFNRMMVYYKDLDKTVGSIKQGKTDNQTTQGLKRPSPTETSVSQPPAKKKAPYTKVSEDSVGLKGNWVPLDEYYYGTHEGDASYTEEKGEYRFKCWYCSKMLYNNVRAMQHIQGHIDASKQQNIDLSDLTQCKHCYKQFDTPFEMQTHVEKVHLSNKVLMCRICEKDFSSQVQLSVHMKSNHHACEMPYVCHLCNFRSSMYSDVVDHFKKKHDSSHYLLCLYCLRTFEVKFVSQGVGQTQTYYGHLLKHQTKSATKKCVVCRLTFFNTQDVKSHRKNCHVGNYKDVKAIQGGKVDSNQKQRKGSNLKSLNAPSVSRIQDYGDIIFPAEASNTKCVECKMMMTSTDHYKKYVHCSMCRFATSCSVAYANHMMGFHSGQMSSLNLNIPWERPMKNIMYCACGFNSKYGNKIANHLVYCGKWTSYSTKRSQSSATAGGSGDSKKEGSILGMLGLVQKSSVTTIEDSDEIISKPRIDKKITKKEVEEVVDDTSKKVVTKKKPGIKPVAQKPTDKSDENDLEDVKAKDELVKHETKLSDESSDKSKDVSVDTEKDNSVKEAEVIDLDSELDTTENLKKEEESGNAESEKDVVITKDETKKELDNVSEENVAVSPKGGEQSKEENEEMDQETISDAVVKTGCESDEKSDMKEKEISSEPKETDEMDDTDDKPENKVTSVEEGIDTETDLKVENPEETLEKTEEMETTDEVDKGVEQDSVIESPKGNEEEKTFHETSEEVDKDTESKNTVDNVAEEEEMPDEVKETGAEQESAEEKDTESEVKQTESMQQEQEAARPTHSEDKSSLGNDEKEPKEEEETPKEGNEPEEQEKEKVSKVESRPQKESENEDEREKSMEKVPSSDRRSSSEWHSQERRTDSSERYSAERRESAERYHSGSRDRPRYDERSRHEDRHHHDNRSHGSNRSDNHHDNRSSYRDRSYDRDRDYNRNRHGDNRSGHGYHDNRGYGGGQGHRGQYGGFQGNRGDHYQDRNRGGNNQDRNYNRNFQNRGGYNQNYRGNYRGGYY